MSDLLLRAISGDGCYRFAALQGTELVREAGWPPARMPGNTGSNAIGGARARLRAAAALLRARGAARRARFLVPGLPYEEVVRGPLAGRVEAEGACAVESTPS